MRLNLAVFIALLSVQLGVNAIKVFGHIAYHTQPIYQ